MSNNNQTIDFPTTERYSALHIKQVQKLLLKMANTICGILDKHNIPYFISFGTLLGAVRHEGFVPWDDDFDLFLFDDTYDEAMNYLEEELPNRYLIHSIKTDPLYFPAWNCVRDITTKVESGGLYNSDNDLLKYQCIGVDMYRLKKMGTNQIKSYKINEALIFFNKKLKFGLMSLQEFNEESKLLKKQLKQALSEEVMATDKTEVYMFMITLKYGIAPESVFPLKKYTFENQDFYGPNSHHEILTSTYGCYMELPEYEKRKPHFLEVSFNVEY